MSHHEIERFQGDIRLRPDLIEKIKVAGQSLGSITETARTEGYDFDLDELKGYIVSKSSGSLSDEQLASVAAAGSTFVSTNTIVVTLTVGAVIGGVVAIIVVT